MSSIVETSHTEFCSADDKIVSPILKVLVKSSQIVIIYICCFIHIVDCKLIFVLLDICFKFFFRV
jgi:hypothetical protein